MYAVVQIGSRIARFECGTMRSTLSCALTEEKKRDSATAARTRRFIGLISRLGNRRVQDMARIAIGGFQHETNTFAPSKADYAAFEDGGGWPGVQFGPGIFPAVQGANIPAEGAIQALRALGHTLVGTAWGAASPSAHVTDDAFERIAGGIVSHLKEALPVDGVYLDLHGAM